MERTGIEPVNSGLQSALAEWPEPDYQGLMRVRRTFWPSCMDWIRLVSTEVA